MLDSSLDPNSKIKVLKELIQLLSMLSPDEAQSSGGDPLASPKPDDAAVSAGPDKAGAIPQLGAEVDPDKDEDDEIQKLLGK